MGWVRADAALIRRLVQLRAAQDLAGPVLEQLTAVRLLEQIGDWLPQRRAEVAQRCLVLQAALGEQLPSWRAPLPDGGLALWVRLPTPRSSALAASARALGLGLTAGPRFGVDGGFETRLRLPFTASPAGLREAVRLLARLWGEHDPAVATQDSAVVV